MMRTRIAETPILFTIGYQGRGVDDVLTRLKSSEIAVLIDVRYRPQSRKPGFSRTKLSQSCARIGIQYIHSRGLGTPPDMMRRLGVGGYDAAGFREYRRYLRTQSDALHDAERLLERGRCCLLCYEADASTCHRRVVAEELCRMCDAAVSHL